MSDFGDRFEVLDRRLDGFEDHMDARFEAVDRRFDALESRLDGRFEAIDRRFAAVEHRLDSLDGRMSPRFRWLVGGQVTVLMSVIGTLSAALFLA